MCRAHKTFQENLGFCLYKASAFFSVHFFPIMLNLSISSLKETALYGYVCADGGNSAPEDYFKQFRTHVCNIGACTNVEYQS